MKMSCFVFYTSSITNHSTTADRGSSTLLVLQSEEVWWKDKDLRSMYCIRYIVSKKCKVEETIN